jgi:asparagine N-glycosylation enzyme membrane subunit Stt3
MTGGAEVPGAPSAGETGPGGAGAPGGRPPGDLLGPRGRVIAGIVVFVLYAVSFLLRGSVLPGLVGGALAGVLVFLLLREAEDRRRRRQRR